MKIQSRYIIILLLLIFIQTIGLAQCPYYETLINDAKKYWSQNEFNLALKKLNSAREHCPQKSSEIDSLNASFMIAITLKYREAEEAKKNANREANNAKQQEKNAIRAKELAKIETEKAQKAAHRAKSLELAANALLVYEKDKDETLALRLAYAALTIDTIPQVQEVFDKFILNPFHQYYIQKYKGEISRFTKDSARFWTYDGDSTRLYDWAGKSYGAYKGEISSFNKDSARFWTYDRKIDSTRLYDWAGKSYGAYKGEISSFTKDSARFWTYDLNIDSTRLYDWAGKSYGAYKGYISSFTKDSARFWTYDGDSTRLYDWAGKS